MNVDLLQGLLFSKFVFQFYVCYLIYLEKRMLVKTTMFLLTGRM